MSRLVQNCSGLVAEPFETPPRVFPKLNIRPGGYFLQERMLTPAERLTILLIEDSPEYVELVQTWLALDKQDQPQLLWTDTLAAGLKRLQAGGIDLVLLDLGLPDSEGAATFQTIRESFAMVPAIILSGADSEALALEMIRLGAEDYLVKSTCNAASLSRSLRYALVRHDFKQFSAKTEAHRPKTVLFVGAKGGVGTTTLAWLFASELHKQTQQPVLLADLDTDHGMISFLANIEPAYSAKDAVENLARLDRSVWDRIICATHDGLAVLASPGFLGGGVLEPAALRSVLSRAQQFYPFIVVDGGRFNSGSGVLATLADDVVICTTSGIPSLYSTKRCLAAPGKASVPHEAIRLIINNLGDSEGLSRKDLTSAFGAPVLGVVPHDPAELHKAAMERRLPAESSAARREMVNIVREWSGLEPLKRKGRLLPLFSRERTGT